MQIVLAAAGLPPLMNAGIALIQGVPRAESKPGTQRGFHADEEIFAECDRAAFFYKVVSGTVRTCKLLSDGRRQIDAFHLPGDIFGIEAGEEHRFAAEAVTETVVIVYRRSDRDALAGGDGALAREIVGTMMRALERAQDHMMLLGRKSARERIASFLLAFSERTAPSSCFDALSRAEPASTSAASAPGDAFDLPMSRMDIADHLGLTIESVSRSLTQLERDGVIELPPNRRSIRLRDRAALRRLDA